MPDKFGPGDFTPEQAAAYVNATAVTVMAELLSMHWANEQARIEFWAKGKVKLPYQFADFQRRIERHCVNHDNVMTLFARAGGHGRFGR